MKILGIIEEDFTQYKEPAMVVMFPHCTFKCEKDSGCAGMCHNKSLINSAKIDIDPHHLVDRFLSNSITSSLVLSGLEPFDSPDDLMTLITSFRAKCDNTIVIYTGYNKSEINVSTLSNLHYLDNIIIKFGRYVPNQSKHLDELLGIYLASDNQYAERI